MPVIGFMALLGGGLLVWTGYLGQPIGKVTRAVLDGNTKGLTRIPLDPDQRPKTPSVSPTAPQGKTYTRPKNLPPGAVLNSTLDGYTYLDPKTGNLYTYDLSGNQTGVQRIT